MKLLSVLCFFVVFVRDDVIINKELVANNATLEDCQPVTTQCQVKL